MQGPIVLKTDFFENQSTKKYQNSHLWQEFSNFIQNLIHDAWCHWRITTDLNLEGVRIKLVVLKFNFYSS